MADLVPVDFDPFRRSPLDTALSAEGVSGPVADIAKSIYQQESGSGKNTKTSNAGAVGGMQIIPATFQSVADKGWDINDPTQNARAGVRYIKQLYDQAGGNPTLTAAGYYGGPGGLEKARRGVAVSDPRNPNAPDTLQYGQQVAARLPASSTPPVASPAASSAKAEPQLVPVDFNPFAKQEAPSTGDKIADGAGRFLSGVVQGTKNLVGGAVRGAGSIGATLMAPVDMASDALAGKGLSLDSNRQRRADMDDALRKLGADPNSLTFQAGKLGGEIAGTAGVGPALGAGAKAVGAAPKIVNALESGGMTLGGSPATSLAGKVGNLLTRVGGGAVTGGASAGLVDPESAKTGAIVGGAIPVGAAALGTAGNALGRAITGGGASPEVQALADRAKQLGIDIPADRLVNSKPLNALASSLNYVPLSGRAATERTMQDQLNTALSRTFGQDSDNVTMALRKAQGDLGDKFDQVLKNNTVKVDPQFMQDIGDVSAKATRELSPDLAAIINKQIDDIASKAGSGEIDGQAAYNIKKTLDRLSDRNSSEAYYARDLKGVLMSALDRSLGPQQAAEFAGVRKQYGNMLSLENLAQNGVDGDISIARLANMKNINNPDLQELADISAQFLKGREGQHGAAQRVFGGMGATGTGAAAAFFGLPAVPVAIGAGMAAGRGTNMLLNSNAVRSALLGAPQTNRLLQNAPTVGNALLRGAPVAVSDR